MRYQVLRRFRCRYGPNSGDELFDTSGRYSIAGTIRGGNGERAAFDRFGARANFRSWPIRARQVTLP